MSEVKLTSKEKKAQKKIHRSKVVAGMDSNTPKVKVVGSKKERGVATKSMKMYIHAGKIVKGFLANRFDDHMESKTMRIHKVQRGQIGKATI